MSSKEEIYVGGEITPQEKEPSEGSFSVIGTCEEVFACSDLSPSEEEGLTRYRSTRTIYVGVYPYGWGVKK